MSGDDLSGEIPKRIDLRQMTQARVRIGHVGAGIPTHAAQSFLLDHARARQAVWSDIDRQSLGRAIEAEGLSSIVIESQAADRSTYIRRPDLGRLLSQASQHRIDDLVKDGANSYDIVIVVADGLSASAVELNALPMIRALMHRLSRYSLSLAPIFLAAQARVALADPIGEKMAAKATIMLIGERPGLSAADSLGAYITYAPVSGTPDSRRNCISNIRDGGLSAEMAADTAMKLLQNMLKTGISGVNLKQAVAALPSD